MAYVTVHIKYKRLSMEGTILKDKEGNEYVITYVYTTEEKFTVVRAK